MTFSLTRLQLSFHVLHGEWTSARLVHTPSKLPHPPPIPDLAPEHENEAPTWLTNFRTVAAIPKHLVELSFSRSSGPGGQNVNKLSTKVTARCRVDAPWIPLWSRDNLVRTPYYVKSTHSLLMTSSASRSQACNVDDVLSKLHALVAEAATRSIVRSPTQEQQKRVVSFQKTDDARRRLQKDKRSAAKRSRSNKDWE